MNKVVKKIIYDVLGVLCLIGVVVFGWLPGPGGVPLLLAGLGLLSVHHDWARRLLQTAKQKGTNLYAILFPDNPNVHWVYDIVGIVLVIVSFWFFIAQTKNYVQILAVLVFLFSVGLLLTNRKRLEKISRFLAKNSKRKH